MARKFLNGIDVVGQLATAIGANLSSGKLLGRSTAGTGAIEEISVGSGLTLSAGTLEASGGSGGTTFTYSSSAPASPSAGDEWLDNTSGILYTYVNDGNSSAWVELGPFGAESISPTIAGMIF